MKFAASTVLLAFAASFTTTTAIPLEKKAALTVFDPRITFPAPGATFQRGQTITVEWDTTSIPAGTLNLGLLVLAHPDPATIDSANEGIDFNHTLANGFKLIDGHTQITWPTDIPAGTGYGLVLFGDSGNLNGLYTLL